MSGAASGEGGLAKTARFVRWPDLLWKELEAE